MEEFDAQLQHLNIQKVVDRVSTMGYPVDFDQTPPIMPVKKCLAENLSIIKAFVDQKIDQSLEHFYAEYIFSRLQSKKETGQFCFSLIYSLQIHQTTMLELLTVLYLYCIDQSQNLSEFYLFTRQVVLDYLSINDHKYTLDDVKIRLDDWISISSKIFSDEPTQKIVNKMTNLISLDMARKSNFDPYRILTGARFQQILIKVYIDRRQKLLHQEELEQQKKIREEIRKKELNFDIFKGFYRWSSPLFRKEEFLKNPQNIQMLKDVKEYRRKYPVMHKNATTPQKKKKKTNQSLTPVKQSPVRRQINQNLKKELQRVLKDQNKYKLRFNLSMYYYQHVNNENVNKFQLLEQKYLELHQVEQYLLIKTEEFNQQQLNHQISQLQSEIDEMERQLRNEGILRPSMIDQFQAAGKTTFKEKINKSPQKNQSTCISANQVRKDDKFGNYMVSQFNAEFFDTSIQLLPKPLDKEITYENIVKVFDETINAQNFQPINFQAITNFISKDVRYLQLIQFDQILAVAQLNDYLVGYNQKKQVGCFAPQYVKQI